MPELVQSRKKKKRNSSQLELEQRIEHNIPRSTVKLKFLAKPDQLDFSLPENHIALITDDGSLTTSILAQSLTERGWKVVVLSFPQSLVAKQLPLPTEVNRVVLQELSEEHIKQQVTAITANFGPIAAFINLNPVSVGDRQEGIRFLETEAVILKQVFFLAKHLKTSLNQAASLGRSCFFSVTRLDGEFGLGRKVNYSPIGAGLFGLTKTLNYEWKPVFCRAVDLSHEFSEQQSAQYILAELYDPNCCLVEVGYGAQGRTTLITE